MLFDTLFFFGERSGAPTPLANCTKFPLGDHLGLATNPPVHPNFFILRLRRGLCGCAAAWESQRCPENFWSLFISNYTWPVAVFLRGGPGYVVHLIFKKRSWYQKLNIILKIWEKTQKHNRKVFWEAVPPLQTRHCQIRNPTQCYIVSVTYR